MNTYFRLAVILIVSCFIGVSAKAQKKILNDSNTPLHLLQPDYVIPYGPITANDVMQVVQRVHGYLDEVTPPLIVHTGTKEPVKDLKTPQREAALKQGDFRLTSYEWGVTYSGMMLLGEKTKDKRFTSYAVTRLDFLADAAKYFTSFEKKFTDAANPLRSVLHPHALDDAGSICASMIKAENGGLTSKLRPLIDNYINYIMTKEYRFKDGTLARNRPLPNTLWLDDLYMSVPAIAQMGKLTGEQKYYDEAVKQIDRNKFSFHFEYQYHN